MTYRVIYDAAAEQDLDEIGDWIAESASEQTAIRYLARLTRHCQRLDMFPMRGTARDDLYPGLRTTGFERRVLIAFMVRDNAVVILRLLYGGQDADAVLGALKPSA